MYICIVLQPYALTILVTTKQNHVKKKRKFEFVNNKLNVQLTELRRLYIGVKFQGSSLQPGRGNPPTALLRHRALLRTFFCIRWDRK